MKDENNSWYIKPFIKGDKNLEKAMNEHVNHQSKLSPQQERLEGTVMPYAMNQNDWIKRR